jgi:hypothetical protein
MNYHRHIGIDPGKDGSIVIIHSNGTPEAHKMPMLNKSDYDMGGLFELLRGNAELPGEAIVVLEDVHSIFGASAKSNFQFGKGCGIIEAMIVAAGLSYVKVSPKKWQKVCLEGVREITKAKTNSVGKAKVDTKAMAEVAAKRLYPKFPLNFGGRAVKAHDGLVDALLMAHYARVTFK